MDSTPRGLEDERHIKKYASCARCARKVAALSSTALRLEDLWAVMGTAAAMRPAGRIAGRITAARSEKKIVVLGAALTTKPEVLLL